MDDLYNHFFWGFVFEPFFFFWGVGVAKKLRNELTARLEGWLLMNPRENARVI